ncbi:MAG: thioredoxin-disulfide reductase [Thermoflexaceae bacterium]|nr:thioredoxin-disulfide reductase [Thermoflexaceae bacterium]
MSDIYDVIIIGSGPAGLSAAVYAARGGLRFIVLEGAYASGGQILNTHEVDNYLGLYNMNGFDMGMKFYEHARNLGAEIINKDVTSLNIEDKIKEVLCSDGTIYHGKNIILATGALAIKLGVEGEETFKGRGVSYCASCDGNFFRDKVTAVVGGGDTALADAVYLARICKKVYVIHRRDAFRGAKSLSDRLFENENVEVLWDTVVEEINGEEKVESLTVRNVKMEMQGTLKVDGIFIAIGTRPLSKLLDGKVLMDEQGYILAGENCATNVPGVFVAGDVRKKPFRQIITAASDGANAINSVISSKLDK